MSDGSPHARRLQVGFGQTHAFGDFPRQLCDILPGELLCLGVDAAETTAHLGSRVTVGGADHDVGAGDCGHFADMFAGGFDDVPRNVTDVERHHSCLGTVLFEYQRLGLQWIVRTFIQPHVVIAGHRHPARRRDVDGGPAGAQLGGGCRDR